MGGRLGFGRLLPGILLLASLACCAAHVSIGHHSLRLRGGAWGDGAGQKAAQEQQASQELEAVPQTAVPGAVEAAAPAQPTLMNHAVEYALAGGFDGIRSGVGQAVGGQMAGWVGGALSKGASRGGMAFCNVLSKIPLIKRVVKPATCAATGGDAGSAASQAAAQQVPITGVCVCLVTVPTEDVGDSLSALLVQSGLVACVNQVPGVSSTYFWEGKVQKDTECLLMIKTNREQLADVAAVVKDKHPYDNPEFICIDVVTGLPDYLAWVRSGIANPPPSAQ